MDHIYPTKDYKEYVIKDEIKRMQECLNTEDTPKNFDDIARVLAISQKSLKTKSLELCRLFEDYGAEEASDVPEPFNTFSAEALQLNCIQFLRRGNVDYKRAKLKCFNSYREKCPANVESDEDLLEPYSDSVITIRFYEPFKYTPSIKNQPKFHQEYQVLGSNFLTDLRDKFYCQCNYGPFFDISDDPKGTKSEIKEETLTNPGFFYVHDTFYNDTRNPQSIDYSACIINWMKKLNYVRDFKSSSMQNTKIEDLRIRIGYPCVYQHHGACEHIFCITSVDLLDSSESLAKGSYPKLVNARKSRAVLCDTCNQSDANFMVTDCPLHVKDPMRMCEECFFSFHYIDGEIKMCDFKAYKLYDVNPKN